MQLLFQKLCFQLAQASRDVSGQSRLSSEQVSSVLESFQVEADSRYFTT